MEPNDKWDTERSNAGRSLLKRFPLVAYFGLAYAIAWLFWLPLAASSHNWLPVRLPATVFYNLAALGPLCAAVIVSEIDSQGDESDPLLRRLGFASGVVCPLEHAGAPIGAIGVYALAPRCFTHAEVAFCETISHVAAGAIARLKSDCESERPVK